MTVGVPTRGDEIGLRQLAQQLRDEKVKVKLFLRHTLHAKLYLIYRSDLVAPTVGYLGSSNLTLAGLSQQGELNVDVVDADSCDKLEDWFEDRWCIDISKELVEIIEQSWAREEPIPPYHIYIKMAYHLSQEARAGLTEFRIPREFENKCQLRSSISNEDLAALVIDLWETDRLCLVEAERQTRDPQIVCSLGLRASRA